MASEKPSKGPASSSPMATSRREAQGEGAVEVSFKQDGTFAIAGRSGPNEPPSEGKSCSHAQPRAPSNQDLLKR